MRILCIDIADCWAGLCVDFDYCGCWFLCVDFDDCGCWFVYVYFDDCGDKI